MKAQFHAAAALAALVMLVAPPASAQSAPVKADLECLAAMSMMGSMDDAQAKSAGQLGGLFFLGKIFAGDPDIDLNTALLAVARQTDPQKVPALLERCGKEVQQRGGQLAAAGKYVGEHAN